MNGNWTKILILLISSILTIVNAKSEETGVIKYVFANGFTLLIRKTSTTQNVAIHLWVNVGSKDETLYKKGIAHLIEHMLFKGGENVSETDAFALAQKLSGSINAATDYDHTRITIELPRDVWQYALPLLAECLSHCTLKEDYLNSELNAVVQELNMYRDNAPRSLLMELLALVYPQHPYGIPVIGYKKDLWRTHEPDLKNFYSTFYQPRNAVLVVVGNIDPADVIKKAEAQFGALSNIPTTSNHTNQTFAETIPNQRSFTLHRDVVQPQVNLAFKIPGLADRSPHDAYSMMIIQQMVINSKTARLHKKLVDELQLVDSIGQYNLDLEDSDISIIAYEPKNEKNINQINSIIFAEFKNIADNGCETDELQRASKQFQTSYYQYLESNAAQAIVIGEYYLATGDENYVSHMHMPDLNDVNNHIKELVAKYFRQEVAYTAVLLPFTEEQKKSWLEEQQQEDAHDAQHLAERIRTSQVEGERYAATVSLPEHVSATYPKPHIAYLNNGIRVLYYQTDHVPTIKFALKLNGPDYSLINDIPKEQLECLRAMMFEGGTQTHTTHELAESFERLGVARSLSMWQLNADMMSEDLPQALTLLYEVVSQPAFDKQALEKVKDWMRTSANEFWKKEDGIADMIMTSTIENKHVRTINSDNIDSLTQDNIRALYTNIFKPEEAVITIVGDLRQHASYLVELLNQTFGRWKNINQKEATPASIKTHYLDRDQVILTIGGRSLCRFDQDFDALLLYDEHLNQRLFKLREQTGAFYIIYGSLASGAGNSTPASWFISTKISPERIDEVYDLITEFIKNDIESFDKQKLNEAYQSRSKSYDQNYASNSAIGSSFRTLDELHVPYDYYEKRPDELKRVTLEDVKRISQKILTPENTHVVLVGRVGPQNLCMQKLVNPFERNAQCPVILP